jgi:peptide/nickel transport system ATP-binding protein
MYLGQIVEIGETAAVLEQPAHPYTRLLLDAVPRLGKPLEGEAASQRTDLPSNRTLPTGCFFKERCDIAAQGCERAQHLQGDQSSAVRCHLANSYGQSSI